MSDNRDVATTVLENEKFIRKSLAIETVFKPWLLSVLHNDTKDTSYVGMTKDPKRLYDDIKKLQTKKINIFEKQLSKEQMEKILPTDGSLETDTTQWDITIISFFIKHGTTISAPCGTWKRPIPCNHAQHKITYSCYRIKLMRNDHAHSNHVYNDKKFKKIWADMINIATNLPRNDALMNKLVNLKEGPLDSYQKEINLLKGRVTEHDKSFKHTDSRLEILERSRKRGWICKSSMSFF